MYNIGQNGQNFATMCVLCSHNCGIRVDVEDGRIVAVRGDESHPVSQGYVCNKAYSIGHYVRHSQRLERPLRRRPDGSFEPISWDVAIREIADKLSTIRAAHSPRAIGLVGIGGQGNHMDAPYALSFLDELGSRRWFNAFAQEKTQHPLLDAWMCDASPSSFLHADMHHTDYLLVLGTNAKISNRGHNATETLAALKRDPKRTLVVVDPRASETARSADQHIAVAPGSDVYLLIGMVATLLQEKLYDQAFVAARTRDFPRLEQAFADVDVGAQAGRCELPEQTVRELARAFARAPTAAILFDLGVEQVPFSTLNAYLIRLLLALTGNYAQRGGNVFNESFLPPDAPALERGETERALVSGLAAIRALGSHAMFSPSLVPEEVLTDHPERLRALIVEGANPLLSYADTQRWREAIDRLELLVVIDPAMTETARLADYVLPTPVGYEKWEVSGFPKSWTELYAQVRPPVVLPAGDALPEAEIYARLVEAMGVVPKPPRLLSRLAKRADRPLARAAMMATAALLAKAARAPSEARVIFWLYRTLGPALPAPALTAIWLLCVKNALVRRAAVLRTLGPSFRHRSPFALGEELFRRVLQHPEGVEVARLLEQDNFRDHVRYPDGKIRLTPDPMLDELKRALTSPVARDPAFPFVLTAGMRTPWTANTIQRDPAWRKGKGPHCTLRIHPEDAQERGIVEGGLVTLATRRGSAFLPATLDRHMRRGFVAAPNGFGMRTGDDAEPLGVNLNELTDAADRDPFTGCPHHKHVACAVQACSSPVREQDDVPSAVVA